jgi:hypothetical protein
MSIPDIWPTPNNPSTRVRVSQMNIQRSIDQQPVLMITFQEAIDSGTTTFVKGYPPLDTALALDTMLADSELAPLVAAAMPALEQLAYTMYLRKKAILETPNP